MEDQTQNKEYTPAELEAKRKEMLKFYKDSMPYLKAQHEYEEILCKIDEVRFKRTSIQMQFAMMMNTPENEEEMEDETLAPNIEASAPEMPKTERKLKRN
jgi:hypothetical protein